MDINAEKRNGFFISSGMKKVWSVQLQLLKKLLEVCKKNHLRVWGDGGTMLGTVREHGYIPWDDDIDMVMLRDDYDKLVSIASDEFSPPFFFQTAYSESSYYPRGHAQLRMDGTTAILTSDIFQNIHQGVFIDIFPYDAVPDKIEERDRLIRERSLLMEKLFLVTYGHISIKHPLLSLRYLVSRIDISTRGFKNVYSAYESLFRRFSIADNQMVSCLSFQVDLKKFLRDKHWYDETVYLPFEDVMMPLPKNYHEILEMQYGDYMTPVKAPSYHSSFAVLDADRSYLEYLPILRRK